MRTYFKEMKHASLFIMNGNYRKRKAYFSFFLFKIFWDFVSFGCSDVELEISSKLNTVHCVKNTRKGMERFNSS